MGFCVFYVSVSVSLNSVIAVLDADFHSLPSAQHRQQYCPVYFCGLSPLISIVIFIGLFILGMEIFFIVISRLLLFFCYSIVF